MRMWFLVKNKSWKNIDHSYDKNIYLPSLKSTMTIWRGGKPITYMIKVCHLELFVDFDIILNCCCEVLTVWLNIY